ncbi:MAG: M48 family metalloprotease [Candidatus Woesearchaeota archaeon]
MVFLNHLKTVFLISLMVSLFIGLGYLFGGIELAIILGSISLIFQWLMFYFSDKLVLWMYRAKEVESGKLYDMIRELAHKFDLPMPKVYVAYVPFPNAFATGISPKKSAVCVTMPLLQILNEDELKGVLAHELSHIKNRDTLVSLLAISIATLISTLAYLIRWAAFFTLFSGDKDNGPSFLELIVLSILAPLIATLIHLAISRTREYLADETAARTLRNGKSLANALRKLEQAPKILATSATINTENLFIVNPFAGSSLLALFSTHPPTEKRIKRLEQIDKELR